MEIPHAFLAHNNIRLYTNLDKHMRSDKKKKSPIEEALWWCQLGTDKDDFKTGFGTVATQDHLEGSFLQEYAGKLLGKQKERRVQHVPLRCSREFWLWRVFDCHK
ncbi:hypothetical protein LSAT2_002097 [Lamellibrachia satsuma]|nr:hypothetical protein LSAT2_002097 [Lamellibrachia satsuma]